MTGEPQTTRELYDDIIARRGGAERFSPEQLRLVHALVIALAKPAETDPLLVERLLDLLPKPVSAPESSRDDRDDRAAAVAPLLKLFRHLHESVHTLSAENARLKARLAGGLPGALEGHSTGGGGTAVINPTEVVPPGEWRGVPPMRGPDDPKPRSTTVIDAVPNPPAASAPAKPVRPQSWDETDNGKAWRAWVDAGGSVGRDPWANNQ